MSGCTYLTLGMADCRGQSYLAIVYIALDIEPDPFHPKDWLNGYFLVRSFLFTGAVGKHRPLLKTFLATLERPHTVRLTLCQTRPSNEAIATEVFASRQQNRGIFAATI